MTASPPTFPRFSARPGIVPFAIAISVLNLLGHTVLGFEQAWLHPIVSLATGYACELLIELLLRGWHAARFRGGPRNLVLFLLPAHITSLAVAMLLYANERFLVVVFATAFAIFSKTFFRVALPGQPSGTAHFMNPSNLGIAITLLLFSDWVGVAQPYQFTEGLYGIGDWLLPLLICCSGSMLNWRATKRLPLIGAWLMGFAMQAIVRWAVTDQTLASLLAPMTGTAFVLFTFYMITDPMTTPTRARSQAVFGASVAAIYGVITYAGVVFGLFFSLSVVCACRGLLMHLEARRTAPVSTKAPLPGRLDPTTARTARI